MKILTLDEIIEHRIKELQTAVRICYDELKNNIKANILNSSPSIKTLERVKSDIDDLIRIKTKLEELTELQRKP